MNLKYWWQKLTGQRPVGKNMRLTGAKKDKKDPRDYKRKKSGSIPRSVSHRKYVPEPKSQGQSNSCTGFAATTCFMTNLLIKTPDLKKGMGEFFNKYGFSERFNYYWSRKFNGFFPKDKGSFTRDAMKVMKKKGNMPDRFCPFDLKKLNDEPESLGFKKFFKIRKYYRLRSVEEMKKEVNERSFVLAIHIYDSICDLENFVIPVPDDSDRKLGGHAVSVVGYYEEKGFLIMNSWGRSWGNQGYAWLPEEYIRKADWFDAWGFIPK